MQSAKLLDKTHREPLHSKRSDKEPKAHNRKRTLRNHRKGN